MLKVFPRDIDQPHVNMDTTPCAQCERPLIARHDHHFPKQGIGTTYMSIRLCSFPAAIRAHTRALRIIYVRRVCIYRRQIPTYSIYRCTAANLTGTLLSLQLVLLRYVRIPRYMFYNRMHTWKGNTTVGRRLQPTIQRGSQMMLDRGCSLVEQLRVNLRFKNKSRRRPHLAAEPGEAKRREGAQKIDFSCP